MMKVCEVIEWLFASPLFVALFATMIAYPLLPKCDYNKEQDRRWALRSCSTIFVIVFIISIIYVQLNQGEVIHSVLHDRIELEPKNLSYQFGIPNF